MNKYQHIVDTIKYKTDFELELLMDGLICHANNLQAIPNYQGMQEWAHAMQVIEIIGIALSDREELRYDYLRY